MAFYKTTMVVEVLSEGDEPWPNEFTPLSDVAYEITDGDCSGIVKVTETQELDAEEMIAACVAQGTDPAFFGLEEGEG